MRKQGLLILVAVGWLLVVPVLLAANVFRHLIAGLPAAFFGSAGFEGERRLLLAGLLGVLFVWLTWYWRRLVPGLQRVTVLNGVWAGITTVGGAFGVLVLTWLGTRLTFEPHRMKSLSMLPALKTDDELLVRKSKSSAQALPQRGELVRFRAPSGIETDERIRRVVGLPGDRIEMKRGGFPIINGWEVPTCDVGRYFRWGSQGEINGRVLLEYLGDQAYLTVHINRAAPFEAFVVPEGEVFVLADNRNATLDSRNWRSGRPAALPLEAIEGQVARVLLSKAPNGIVDNAATLSRPGLFFNLHGQNLTTLDQALEECLRSRPQVTSPPELSSGSAAPTPAARVAL